MQFKKPIDEDNVKRQSVTLSSKEGSTGFK